MIDDINMVTDEQIKVFYEQGREGVSVRITHTGNVRRFYIGSPKFDELGTREEVIKHILKIRGIA